MDVEDLIYRAHDTKASDLHLIVSSPPLVRVDGLLRKLADSDVLHTGDVEQALLQITTEEQMSEFRNGLELDFAFSISEIALSEYFFEAAKLLLSSSVFALSRLPFPL